MTMRRKVILYMITLGAMVVVSNAVCAQELTGKGEWRSLSGDAIKGTWTASLVRSGDSVSGTFKLTGSNAFAGGPVSGTLDASSIMLGIMADREKQATFSGKLDGSSIKGEWESDAVNDHGVWFGALAPTKPGDSAAATQ